MKDTSFIRHVWKGIKVLRFKDDREAVDAKCFLFKMARDFRRLVSGTGIVQNWVTESFSIYVEVFRVIKMFKDRQFLIKYLEFYKDHWNDKLVSICHAPTYPKPCLYKIYKTTVEFTSFVQTKRPLSLLSNEIIIVIICQI